MSKIPPKNRLLVGNAAKQKEDKGHYRCKCSVVLWRVITWYRSTAERSPCNIRLVIIAIEPSRSHLRTGHTAPHPTHR